MNFLKTKKKDWPHSPLHRFDSVGTYMVTGGTLRKHLLFKTEKELDLLQNLLFNLTTRYGWQLKAWAIFPNHYHFIADSLARPQSLKKLITHLHASSARELNKLQNQSGRQVWYQYWDTQLTFRNSYYARLNYVMENPVKHSIVNKAEDYHWCSKKWFLENVSKAQVQTITSFKIDEVQVYDDF